MIESKRTKDNHRGVAVDIINYIITWMQLNLNHQLADNMPWICERAIKGHKRPHTHTRAHTVTADKA